jgi:hypothetical protein
MDGCCFGPDRRGGGGGGGGFLLQSTISLTPAQILAANPTPIMLVAAPGPRKTLVLVQSFYQLVFGTIAYANGIGGLNYGAAVSGTASADNGDGAIFTQPADSVFLQIPPTNNIGVPSNIENLGFYYQAFTPYTDGNGTAAITVTYYILDL